MKRDVLKAAIGLPALTALCWALGGASAAWAAGPETVDLGAAVPKVSDVQEGLFPDEACEQLKANGFKCMGFKPAVRFALPSASFQVGSAELPDGLKRQLDVFAQALKGKSPQGQAVRIEGHADASGDPQSNENLSLQRAEAARAYLVAQGVSQDMLKAVGVGSSDLADPGQPLSPKNRRVVIERDHAPGTP
jgi:outer membrane protein OmpA-like peptidoglycan-associated protein